MTVLAPKPLKGIECGWVRSTAVPRVAEAAAEEFGTAEVLE